VGAAAAPRPVGRTRGDGSGARRGEPPRVAGDGGEAGLGAGELPGGVGDGEVELEAERGEIGRGQAEQAAQVVTPVTRDVCRTS
jgi:hypothetical protein